MIGLRLLESGGTVQGQAQLDSLGLLSTSQKNKNKNKQATPFSHTLPIPAKIKIKKPGVWADEMARWTKTLAAQPDDLSSVPGTTLQTVF